MGRGVVRQRDLPGFIGELRARGVTRITRKPARFDGSVVVSWDDPADGDLRDADFRADLLAFLPASILSGAFFLLLAGVLGLIRFLTGGLAGP